MDGKNDKILAMVAITYNPFQGLKLIEISALHPGHLQVAITYNPFQGLKLEHLIIVL